MAVNDIVLQNAAEYDRRKGTLVLTREGIHFVEISRTGSGQALFYVPSEDLAAELEGMFSKRVKVINTSDDETHVVKVANAEGWVRTIATLKLEAR